MSYISTGAICTSYATLINYVGINDAECPLNTAQALRKCIMCLKLGTCSRGALKARRRPGITTVVACTGTCCFVVFIHDVYISLVQVLARKNSCFEMHTIGQPCQPLYSSTGNAHMTQRNEDATCTAPYMKEKRGNRKPLGVVSILLIGDGRWRVQIGKHAGRRTLKEQSLRLYKSKECPSHGSSSAVSRGIVYCTPVPRCDGLIVYSIKP